jgi:hypothetical protein
MFTANAAGEQRGADEEVECVKADEGEGEAAVRVTLTVVDERLEVALRVGHVQVGVAAEEEAEWEESDDEEEGGSQGAWEWEMTMHNKDLGSLQGHLQREYAALLRLAATATFLATPTGGGGVGGGGGGGLGGGVSSLQTAAELERVLALLRTAQDNLQTINTKVSEAP